MALILKLHKTADSKKLVCVTDSDLLGKVFEDGSKQLDFSSAFYNGEEAGEDLIGKHVRSCYIAIFSGTEAVTLGLRLGAIEKENVLVVKGVPQGQCLVG